MNQRGFTLIETLVYLGLFALLLGGAVVAAYNVVESSGRNLTQAMVQEEGGFLAAKINWAISGATGVNLPLLGNTSSELQLSKTSGAVDIDLDPATNKDMRISVGGGSALTLNNSNVSVTPLQFQHLGAANAAEWVTATFTLSVKTPEGHVIARDFTTTKYLRK